LSASFVSSKLSMNCLKVVFVMWEIAKKTF
jgi:hypothetical protein